MYYPKQTQWFYTIWDTLFTLVRIAVSSSFKRTMPYHKQHPSCLIAVNGPSLVDAMAKNADKLGDCDIVVVNHFATTDEYTRLKPNMYVMCDPVFWNLGCRPNTEANVRRTFDCLAKKTNWPCTIYMPRQASKSVFVREQISRNPQLHLAFYNKTKCDGHQWLLDICMSRQLAMPRAENVLVAALALAVYSRCNRIYIAGANNDWTAHTWVDEQNRVRRDDFHFYKEGDAAKAVYFPGNMEDVVMSAYHTFHSYNQIASYVSRSKDEIRIINLCQTSFIDAFDKSERID